MTKVVLEMVDLVLQGVEGLVFNPPPRAASTYQVLGIALRNVQIRHPTEALLLLAIRPVLSVLQVVDDHVRIGLVQLQAMDKQDLTQRVPLLPLDRLLLIPVQDVDQPVEQVFVVAGLGTQEKMHSQTLQVADVRGVARQAIFHHDQSQVRMLQANTLQQAASCVPLAVVLLVPILVNDRLRSQRNDFAVVGMHNRRPQHLMRVGDFPSRRVHFLQATGAVNLLRRKVPRTVQTDQIALFVKYQPLQHLAPLQLTEHVVECRPQLQRIHLVEDLAHLRVGGNALDTEKVLQVRVVATSIKRQQRRILQRKECEARQACVRQADVQIPRTPVCDPCERRPYQTIQRVGRQVLTHLLGQGLPASGLSHGESFRTRIRDSSLIPTPYLTGTGVSREHRELLFTYLFTKTTPHCSSPERLFQSAGNCCTPTVRSNCSCQATGPLRFSSSWITGRNR